MKMTKLISGFVVALLLGSMHTVAHSDKEIGPNGGRILEFSTNQSLHGEVTFTNGTFFVAVLDKKMKPLPLEEQSLVVTGGTRSNPEKPKVEKRGDHFTFPALKGDSYMLVFQFQENAAAKPIIARFEFDKATCPTCKKGEWLCDCHVKKTADKRSPK
jgi:hypothetical protein